MIHEADQELLRAQHAVDKAEKWLRVRTVSRRLDVHWRTVHHWIERGHFGKGGAVQLPNKHWRIKESAVAQLERTD